MVSLLKVVEVTLFEVVEGFTAELVALVDVVVILLLPVVVVITVDSLVTAGETSVVLVVSITVVVVELSALCEEGFVDVKAFGLLIPCVVVVLFNKDTVDSVAFEDELSLVAVVVGSVAVVVSKNNHSIEKYVRHERVSG